MIKKLKPKSEFSRNVLTLMIGTTIAQAIPIAISPILTRIYTPEDFGVFALYMSIASIISVIATGRYELAIMLPKKDSDAINIVALSILISFFVSFISFVIVFIFNTQITNLLNNPEISNWLYFIPITILLTGIYQSFNYWSNRKKQYKRIATSRVVQSGSTASANLGMGFGGFGSSGLIVGQVLGKSISTAILGKLIWNEDKNKLNEIKNLKIFAMAKKYIKFPKITIWSSFINSFYNDGKFIILGIVFLPNIMGQLYLAFRVLMIPVSIISTNIADVLFQKTSVMNNIKTSNKEILSKLIKVLFVLMSIALLPTAIIYFFGENLFSFIFGKNWTEAGQYASVLAIALFFQFSIAPFCKVFYALEKNDLYLFWEFLRIVIVFLPVLILDFLNFKVVNIIWSMSICISLSYIILIIFLTKVLNAR